MPIREQKYKYEPLQKYPHLGPKDAEIWDRYVHANPNKYEYVYYDVRVGEVDCCPDDAPENVRKAWNDLCQLRIDVVGFSGNFFDIIEVKPRAGAGAIGQAMGYEVLFKTENKFVGRTYPVVITDYILPATQSMVENLPVKLLKA